MPASRTARQRFRGFAVAFGATAVAFYLGVSLWAGTPVTWSRVLGAIVAGVALGAIYALAATGLVVTYTTSGIFNFAQGAIGMFMAFVYWQLTQGWGLAEIPALLLVVLVIAPATGVLLDRFAMSRAGAQQPRRAVDGDGRVDAVPHGPCGVDLESERVEIGPLPVRQPGFPRR